LRSAHKNEPKHGNKKFIFSKKNEFFENTGWLAFPNALKQEGGGEECVRKKNRLSPCMT